jgi:hypothetical protein
MSRTISLQSEPEYQQARWQWVEPGQADRPRDAVGDKPDDGRDMVSPRRARRRVSLSASDADAASTLECPSGLTLTHRHDVTDQSSAYP